MRLLFASTSGMGHFKPLVPFIDAAVARGDEVLVVGPPGLEPTLEARGHAYRIGAAPPQDEAAAFRERLAAATPEEAGGMIDREYFGRLCTAAILPALEEACDTWRPDLVLHEPCEYSSVVAANRRGIPHVLVAISLARLEAAVLANVAPVLEPYGGDIVGRLRASHYLTHFPPSVDPSPYPATRRYSEVAINRPADFDLDGWGAGRFGDRIGGRPSDRFSDRLDGRPSGRFSDWLGGRSDGQLGGQRAGRLSDRPGGRLSSWLSNRLGGRPNGWFSDRLGGRFTGMVDASPSDSRPADSQPTDFLPPDFSPSGSRPSDLSPPAAPLPDWWDGSDAPLVYVTFGTMAGGRPVGDAAYRTALDAVAGLPIRVLMTVGRATDIAALGDIPANVHVEPWVEQADALAGAAAVVCHGGSGTTFGALAAGLPLVVVPMFADQPANARLVKSAGAGLVVSPDGIAAVPAPADAARIRRALGSVLSDESYRRAAQRLAVEMAALPTAADLLEAVCGELGGELGGGR